MKKNLMNAALLGLLIATPACSFVSCKDYDDDFNKVNNRLDDLTAAKAKINEEIVALRGSLEAANKKAAEAESKLSGYATKQELEAAKANLNKAIADASAMSVKLAQLDEAKKLIDANTSDIKALKTKLDAVGSKATTFLASADLDKISTLPVKLENQEKALDGYKKRIEALESKAGQAGNAAGVDALKEEVKKLKEANYQTEKQVEAAINAAVEKFQKEKLPQALNMLQTAEVTSLQLRPATFLNGIEAIENDVFGFYGYEVEQADANGVVNFTKEATATGEGSLTYAEAEYNVNPSDAKVLLDKKNFAFNALRSANKTTRGSEEPAVEVLGTPEYKNGILKVAFNSSLEDNSEDSINIVSLSYITSAGEGKTARVVSSDYARVVDNDYTALQVGKTVYLDKAHQEYNLANPLLNVPGAKGVRDTRLTFKVAHTGEEFKLAENVGTYGAQGEDDAPTWTLLDQNAASDSKLKRAGFHYEYALVKNGKDDKSTEAFTIDKNTGVVKAKVVEGAPYTNVGKVAVVRVTLLDKDNNVASVGYFQVKVDLKAIVLAELNADNAVNYNCDPKDAIGDLKFSLKALNEKLATDYKEEWNVWNTNKRYAFAVQTNERYTIENGTAKQVPAANVKGTVEVNYSEDQFGTITLKGLKREDVNINKKGDKYEVILKVTKENNPAHAFYVKLIWTPKEVQAAPTVKFSAIKQESLFINGAIRITSNFDNKVTYDHVFKQDLNAAFKDLKLTLNNAAQYTSIKQADVDAKKKWIFINPTKTTFVGVDGKTYSLRASEDGTKFEAKASDASAWTTVATLTDGTVELVKNDPVVRNLISKFKHSEFANSLTARVAYVTLDKCDKPLTVEGENQYDVKFLRPLDIPETLDLVTFNNVGKVLKDGANVNLHDKKFMVDWRNVLLGGAPDGAHEDHFKNFDATVKVASPENYLTNYQNVETAPETFKKVSETNMAAHFDVKVVAAAGSGAIAPSAVADGWSTISVDKDHWVLRVQYENKGQAVSRAFEVRIPYEVTYYWGVAKGYFVVKIDPTVNGNANANARRK